MTDGTLEAVLRRDRLIVAGALAVIAALAWGYVLWLAADMDMGGMDMAGFRMIPAGIGIMAPANAPWRAVEFAFVFAMWAVMMVGMMAPSAAPMILMYARVGRQAKVAGKPLAATGWFASGYFLAWIGFSLAATSVQWVVERAALLDSRMASASNVFGGIVLIAVGAYQWTPLKDICLAECQSVPVPDAPRRLSWRFAWLHAARASPRGLLCRLLLGSDGTLVCGWGDERGLDRASGAACAFGESHSVRR
jgi:predicted metal-binding membrane protein